MGSYLQSYGVGEERRNRTIKWIILSIIGALLIAWISYLLFHNYSEKQAVKRFLAEVNAKDYQAAYRDWGCTEATPCRNYDYNRFLADWGPSQKVTPPWKVDSVDGCTGFVTVNVKAQGSEVESLAVERSSKTIMFAPAAECQEKEMHWKAFFQRIFHFS